MAKRKKPAETLVHEDERGGKIYYQFGGGEYRVELDGETVAFTGETQAEAIMMLAKIRIARAAS